MTSREALTALALGLAVACSRGGGTPAPKAVSAPAPVGGRIDPAPYREQIEATEALLYANAPLSDDGWNDLSRALLDLHNAIVFRDTSEPAREASRRLFFLSAQVDAEPASRRIEDERVVMRGVWEKIRAEQFAAADWFHPATP